MIDEILSDDKLKKFLEKKKVFKMKKRVSQNKNSLNFYIYGFKIKTILGHLLLIMEYFYLGG
ncbi:hypothetical protein ACP49_11795 [Clostridium botulinum]|nr:hypothetical protein ACP53_06685 [Clostridium botulinum]KON01222.1 hypothetical protein ACP49_11795 [Clostridium botulinum]MCS6165185.1 hypothetical protein [Clostridium botulinum]NEZ94757.1 hypothetical protein [Clostridium botulinum]NFA08667.1 hypothetical protein [Clostridium botulinum]